jgi:hypothetical protein
LARRLLAHESLAATTSPQTEPATVRIYEKLRQQLSVTVGGHGFQVLASRALRLSKSEYPKLSAVQIPADGTLDGLGEVEWQTDDDQNGHVGEVLIAQLLGLSLRLVSVAGEIRKLAMVLDIFALIPRASEGRQEGPSRRPLKGYVM